MSQQEAMQGLADSCKELLEVTAACFRVLVTCPESVTNQLENEFKHAGIKNRFGVRGQSALKAAKPWLEGRS